MKIPKEPVIFFKSTSSVVGPNDDVVIPKGVVKSGLGSRAPVVIGKKGGYFEEGRALENVAGYVLHNDYSDRAFQSERNGQWLKRKSVDTFALLRPFPGDPR